jgi:hypothetical protein
VVAARSEISAVVLDGVMLWDIASRSSYVYRRFGGMCHFSLRLYSYTLVSCSTDFLP